MMAHEDWDRLKVITLLSAGFPAKELDNIKIDWNPGSTPSGTISWRPSNAVAHSMRFDDESTLSKACAFLAARAFLADPKNTR